MQVCAIVSYSTIYLETQFIAGSWLDQEKVFMSIREIG